MAQQINAVRLRRKTAPQKTQLQRSTLPADAASPEEVRIALTSANPQTMTPQVLRSLQATHGNHFVQRLMADQPKAEAHGKGCKCASCSPIQREIDESGQMLADHAAAMQEIHDKAPHEAGCTCPSCSGGSIQMMRMPGESPTIQRDIVDNWKSDSSVFGRKRSPKLKIIDGLVADYVKTRSATKNYGDNIPKITAIKVAIVDWRKDIDQKNKKRVQYVQQLETVLDRELLAFQQEKTEKERKLREAQPFYDAFHTLSQGMGDFAGRDNSYSDTMRFHPDAMGERLKALTQHRNVDGSLDATGIAENDRLDTEQLKDKNLKSGAEATMTIDPSVTPEKLRGLMDKNKNSVTGMTMYPELENVLNPNGKEDKIITETMDINGVSMKITYNKSDVNFDKRVATLAGAVKKIQEAGFTVPALDVHLPKLGRSISVNGECVMNITKPTERAVYVAPNFMHVSSENMGNPLGDKASGKPDKYKFLSTELDPSGVGTIIHEFGHALHYQNAPGKFHELWGSTFKGVDPTSGLPYAKIAQDTVSEYGGKPREFVAEVFLGMVFGRTYSKLVMDMYKRFGGKMP